MNKYRVTLFIGTEPKVSFIVDAVDVVALDWFIYSFYPDTNWDYEVMK